MSIEVRFDASNDEQLEALVAVAELTKSSNNEWQFVLKGAILAGVLAGGGALITTKTAAGFVFAFVVFGFLAALVLAGSKAVREAQVRKVV